MMRRAIAAGVLSLMLAGSVGASPASAATHYKNCTAMHKKYPHGVGLPSAHDHVTSGKPVTTFKHSTPLYNANKSLDRDHDKIACEKR